MKLYHGSKYIIEQPVFGDGNPRNDYGLAFYCTENIEMAKEWAVSEDCNGFANEYEFGADGLKELNLLDEKYNILNWLAILLENRIFRSNSELAEEGKRYILDNFLPEYREYDY